MYRFCNDVSLTSTLSKVVPVVAFSNLCQVEPLIIILKSAGFNCIEVTLRTEVALDAIRKIKELDNEFIIGAGTVITAEQASDAKFSGANFIVSPGCAIDIIEACEFEKIPYIPGVQTISEILDMHGKGFKLLKLFPAKASGGIEFVKAVNPVFPSIKFMPTGGINETNAVNWLSQPNVQCVGGSWIAPNHDLVNNNYQAIQDKCSIAISLINKLTNNA